MENETVSNITSGSVEEKYEPGTLYKLCAQKVEQIFWLDQFTKKYLPMKIIEDRYKVKQEREKKEYINNLTLEFNLYHFGSLPYKYSPNLFDEIVYLEDENNDFSIENIIMRGQICGGLHSCTESQDIRFLILNIVIVVYSITMFLRIVI